MDELQRRRFTEVSNSIHELITERDRKLMIQASVQEVRRILVASEAELEPLWAELAALQRQ